MKGSITTLTKSLSKLPYSDVRDGLHKIFRQFRKDIISILLWVRFILDFQGNLPSPASNRSYSDHVSNRVKFQNHISTHVNPTVNSTKLFSTRETTILWMSFDT